MRIVVPSFAPLLIIVASTLATTTPSNAQSNSRPAAVAQQPTAPTDLSRGTSDILKLHNAGRKENVLVFYAKFSQLEYHLTSKHIAYLHSTGIPPAVIAAMLASDDKRKNAVVIQKDFEGPTIAPEANARPMQPVPSQPALAGTVPTPVQPTFVYPDYSAYPNYYGTFDSGEGSTPRRPAITIGIGLGVGFSDGGFYHGHGYGYGRYGGRRWR